MTRAETQLRVVLYAAAAVCGVAILGVIGPSQWLERWLVVQYGFESKGESLDVAVVYGLRMACAASACAGLYFLVIARDPYRYGQFVNLGATVLVFAGLVAFIAGAGMQLAHSGYLIDAGLLGLLGMLLFVLSPKRAKRGRRRNSSRSGRRSRSSSRRKRRSSRSDSTRGEAGSEGGPGLLS